MRQMTVMVPNSVKENFDHIELLVSTGVLSEVAGRLYQTLTVYGWEDGFVRIEGLEGALTANEGAAAAILQLQEQHLVSLRVTPDGEHMVELTALALPECSGHSEFGWWKFYRLGFMEV